MPTPFSQKEILAEIPLPLWQITFRPFFSRCKFIYHLCIGGMDINIIPSLTVN
jgi:hypothetical protein